MPRPNVQVPNLAVSVPPSATLPAAAHADSPSRVGAPMTPRSGVGLGQKLLVAVPTVLVSALLGRLGMPALPRLIAALGFGAVLIAGLAYYRRKTEP